MFEEQTQPNYDLASSKLLTPLTFEDVEGVMQPLPPGITDQVTLDAISQVKKSLAMRRVNMINSKLDVYSESWPEGRPLEFYIGLELCRDNLHEFESKMANPKFINVVRSHAIMRGVYGSKKIHDQPIPSLYQKGSSNKVTPITTDDESEEMFTYGGSRGAKRGDQWSPSEINRFKSLVGVGVRNHTWKEFSERFPGHTPEQCKRLFHKIRIGNVKIHQRRPERQSRVHISLLRTREQRTEKENAVAQKKKSVEEEPIVGLTFVKGSLRVRVGPQSERFNEYQLLNPFVGYIDQITMQEMRIPAMSPDGYILDYSTWLKILKDKNINPFTTNHISSKRNLVILTVDNVDQYRDKIVNLEESKPAHASSS